MNFILTNFKSIHWTAVLLAVLSAAIATLAKEPSLANEAVMLNWLAGTLLTGGMGAALSAHKVGFTPPSDSSTDTVPSAKSATVDKTP